jgi:hypothetical protein
MADETQAAVPVDATPVASAPVDTPAAPVVDETPVATPPVEATASLSDLEEAMNAGFPADDTADASQAAEQPAIAPDFQQVLGISEFVKSPEHVQAAVRAADEVWKVATGQVPARTMLEGMRAANPGGFERVVGDLVPYLEQVTGKKFGGAPDAPPDPNQARLDAIEARFAKEENDRQQAAYVQQMTKARDVATETITKLTKGTAFEGNEAYLLQQCAAKTNVSEKEMVDMLLRGFTKPLESALKTVQKEEAARIKQYNDKLIQNYRKLKNAVPATKGAPAAAAKTAPAYLPGETPAQFATRVWNSGQV